MKQEKTIGIIPFKKTPKGPQYLLLRHHKSYWNFPKGRVDPGEEGDELKTAFRETWEEAGLSKVDLTLMPGFRATYEYFMRYPETTETVKKQAIFYLAECNKNEIVISDEHRGYGWFQINDALKKIRYKNGQRLLHQANRFIQEKLKK